MWARISHTLAPSTKLTSSKVKNKWIKTKQEALEEIKRIVTRNNLLDYLYFNREFKIHKDASVSN